MTYNRYTNGPGYSVEEYDGSILIWDDEYFDGPNLSSREDAERFVRDVQAAIERVWMHGESGRLRRQLEEND